MTPEKFMEALPLIWKGYLSVFIVIAVIMLVVYLLNTVFSGKNK